MVRAGKRKCAQKVEQVALKRTRSSTRNSRVADTPGSSSPATHAWSGEGGEIRPGLPHVFVFSALPGHLRAPAKSVAAFDMDWCLIRPKSGGQWPHGAADWRWLFDCVPDSLRRQVREEGRRLLILSNQGGFEKGRVRPEEIREKCEQMLRELRVPADIILVSGASHFRKPETAAWHLYVNKFNGGQQFEPDSSIFVGDAAGRPAKPGRKKDFSCSDRMFASNVGLPFATPEEFFLGERASDFSWGVPDPRLALANSAKLKQTPIHREEQELLMLIGMPASGKSTLSRNRLVTMGYCRINRDELKTKEKCLAAAETAMKEKKSVVIDNLNASAADRAPFISLAKKLKVPSRAILLRTEESVAQHLNFFRQAQTESRVRRVPMVAYRIFKSKFAKPSVKEGFDSVEEVDFVFDETLLSDREKKLVMQWRAAD